MFITENAKNALYNLLACDCKTCKLRSGALSDCSIRDLSNLTYDEFNERCEEERQKNLIWLKTGF